MSRHASVRASLPRALHSSSSSRRSPSWRKRQLAQAEEPWKLTPFHPLDFGEAAVARGLADENLIGKGGSRRVYRVAYTSRSSGDAGGTVAVKRIWTGGNVDKSLERAFAAEVDVVGHIHHSNIVKLL